MSKVLIVDDSMMTRKVIMKKLSEILPNSTFVDADCGEAALAIVQEGEAEFDLVILDYNMPGMNGLELASKLREINPGAKYVLCTANLQDSLANRARETDISVLHKPVNADKLREHLAEVGVTIESAVS